MSADSYTINVTGNSNNTDLILESASSAILEGGTNTIEQTIVADPTLSNDYDVNNLGEIRNVTADGIHNLLDLEFSSKHPWTKALKETWNNTTLGDVGTPGMNRGDMSAYPVERHGLEIGSNYFSRNARDVATKSSHFTSVPAGNILEIDTKDYEKKKGYINFWECLNRNSVRSKMQYGSGSETFADHPETYIDFYGVIKSSSPQMTLSPDKKVLYIHGGVFYALQDGTPDISLASSYVDGFQFTAFTMLIAFALDENEELVKKPNGLVADPLIAQRVDKHLIVLDPSGALSTNSGTAAELVSNQSVKDYAVKSSNNKDTLCFFIQDGNNAPAVIAFKLEFNRVNHNISYNGLTYSKEISLANGQNVRRSWELKYCDVNDRFIFNGRFDQGGQSQNHVLFAVDANFAQGDGKVGEIELFHIEHVSNAYSAQLLEEVGGPEALGKTWMKHNGFFKTSNFFVYGGKVFYFLNVLRIIDSNFGLDASANLSKLSYAKDYKNPETLLFTNSGGLGGYHADLTNQVVLLSMMTGGFASGTTLNSRYNNEAGASGNEGRSAQVTIVIPFSELQKSDPKTWKVNVVADRITYTQNMYSISTCFDDKGNAYHSGGYLQNTPGDGGITDEVPSGYLFGLLRVLVEDDNGNKIDYLTPNQQIFYKHVNYNKKYYNYIWSTQPTAIDFNLYNQYTFRCQVLGLENNIKVDSKLTETGLNISKDNLINVNYGIDGLDMHYNGRNSVSVKQSEDAILHLTSSNRNTIVGSNNLRSADLRFASSHKDNIIIGSGVGNVPICENNIILGNNIMNFKSIRDSLVIGNDNKAVLVGDLSNGNLQLPQNSYETAELTYKNRQVYDEFDTLGNLYSSFGFLALYGDRKNDMPKILVETITNIADKLNEVITSVNTANNSNIQPIILASEASVLNVELLIDITFDGFSSEVFSEIITNKGGKIISCYGGPPSQKSVPSLNPLSPTGFTSLIDSAVNTDYKLYKFPLELNQDNNLAFIYMTDSYGDQSSHTNLTLEDKFKLFAVPQAESYPLPLFIEKKPSGIEYTAAMLRVTDLNNGSPLGGLTTNRKITTACEITNGSDSKLKLFDESSFIYKKNARIHFNYSLDNDGGFGPYYPLIVPNIEKTEADGSISYWMPMVLDSAIKEWFKDGETYSGFNYYAGHKKGHMFNIAECVDLSSVKLYFPDTSNVVDDFEVLFAPFIEGEVGPDASWEQRYNSAINMNGGSFWTDNSLSIITGNENTKVSNNQMQTLLQNNNPGGYYRDFVVWNPLLMLFKVPKAAIGFSVEVRMDVDLTKYGLRKEHIEMRLIIGEF